MQHLDCVLLAAATTTTMPAWHTSAQPTTAQHVSLQEQDTLSTPHHAVCMQLIFKQCSSLLPGCSPLVPAHPPSGFTNHVGIQRKSAGESTAVESQLQVIWRKQDSDLGPRPSLGPYESLQEVMSLDKAFCILMLSLIGVRRKDEEKQFLTFEG